MIVCRSAHNNAPVLGFVALPPPLERLLDATIELREVSGQSDGLIQAIDVASGALVVGHAELLIFRRRLAGLADLIEREVSALIRAWADTVRRCDSCDSWFPARDAVLKGTGLARVQLCPGCARTSEPIHGARSG